MNIVYTLEAGRKDVKSVFLAGPSYRYSFCTKDGRGVPYEAGFSGKLIKQPCPNSGKVAADVFAFLLEKP